MTDIYYYKCAQDISENMFLCLRSEKGFQDFQEPGKYTNIHMCTISKATANKRHFEIIASGKPTLEERIIRSELKTDKIITILDK